MKRTPVRLCFAIPKLGWILFLATCLGGCGRLVPNLFVPEPYSENVPYTSTAVFDFDQLVSFAQHNAKQWDPDAKLNSINRQTLSNSAELTTGQQVLVRYWRPQLYLFGSRIEWYEVALLPEESNTSVQIWTSLNTSWNNPPVDLATLTITYETAMRLALERGGSAYMADHPSCYLSMALEDNKWYFLFKADPWMITDDVLHFCVDGITGEPCEVPIKNIGKRWGAWKQSHCCLVTPKATGLYGACQAAGAA